MRAMCSQEAKMWRSKVLSATLSVDSGYCGEIHAIISNVSREPHTIQKDTRIGQPCDNPGRDR